MRHHSWRVDSILRIRFSGYIWSARVLSIDLDCGDSKLELSRSGYSGAVVKEWPNHWICSMIERAEKTYRVYEEGEDVNINLKTEASKNTLDKDILDGAVKVVGVQFVQYKGGSPTESGIYFFKAPETYELNDMVVVDTKYGLKVARVVRPHVSVAELQRELKSFVSKCVVCKVEQ